MDTIRISTNVNLVTEDCCICGIVFAVPESKIRRCEDKGEVFYCPNGHSMVYKETTIDRLRHRLEHTEAALQTTSERLDGALKEVTNKNREITRIKNRVHAGVCTECHRHFENLERHMRTKHSKED